MSDKNKRKNKGNNKNAKDKRPNLKSPQKIELSEKNIKGRFIAFIVFLVIAIVSFSVFFVNLLTKENGWTVIESEGGKYSFANEIEFNYNLGSGKASATSDYKKLSAKYTNLTTRLYKLFDPEYSYDGVVNLHYISNHIGEELTVDPVLYKALSLYAECEDRSLYLQPLYLLYESLCFASEDVWAKAYDPYFNESANAYATAISSYASNPSSISLELLNDNKVRLDVSESYQAFAEEYEITGYLGFGFLRNAFVIDCIAESLITAGYTYGNLTSSNGYIRNLDSKDSYAFNILDVYNNEINTVGCLNYTGGISIVNFRNYQIPGVINNNYYTYKGGMTVTPYIDSKDGKYRSSIDTFYAYSFSGECAEIAMKTMKLYISDSFDTALLNSLIGQDIRCLWCDDLVVRYSDESADIDLFNAQGGLTYTKEEY